MEDFRTHDIKVASFLFAKGIKYLGIEGKEERGRTRYEFIFEDAGICRELEIAFINDAPAPAKKLLEARETFIDEVRKQEGKFNR